MYMYMYIPAEVSDYERLSTEVTLSPSDSEQCVSVEVVDDSAVELDESLTVSLSLPAGGLSSVQLTPNTATILITDNDGTQISTINFVVEYMKRHTSQRIEKRKKIRKQKYYYGQTQHEHVKGLVINTASM